MSTIINLLADQRVNDRLITYSVLPPVPPHYHQRVMKLLDVDSEEMLRWEVLPAFQTPVCVGIVIMRFVLAVAPEGQGLLVRRQGAFHDGRRGIVGWNR